MSPLEAVASWLRCPRCGQAVEVSERTLRCASGHAFDLARQGYVNLLDRPAGAAADDATMIDARVAVQSSGLFDPVTDAIVDAVTGASLPRGLLVDVGAGTGHHTAAVLDACPDRLGVALDLSAAAARRAARAHPRLAALVADARAPFPVRSGGAAVILDVFAPRNGAEFARVLNPAGAVVVATPTPDHLKELVSDLALPRVDPHKRERLAETLAAFAPESTRHVRRTTTIEGRRAAALARMGPGAHHVAPDRLETLAATQAPYEVTLDVEVTTFRRR